MNEVAKGDEADLSEDFLLLPTAVATSSALPFWPDDVLDELLAFVPEDAASIPGLNVQLVQETCALVIVKAKSAAGAGQTLARATQAESAEQRWRNTSG